jgi:hypothetical protein
MRVDPSRFRDRVLLLPAFLALGVATATSAEPPKVDRAAVTATTLLDHEHLWPYRVSLTEAWQPPGADAPLPAGEVGVLIRVQPGEVARIDFSSDGKHDVPVAKTDLVQNANRISRGEIEKPAPNFVFTIAHHVLDPKTEPLKALDADQISHQRAFLCVFANDRADGFDELVAALRPLAGRADVATIFFPQGRHPSAEVRERLRASDWLVPFLFDHLSEPYTRTLLREGTPIPFVMLVTNEGRVLFEDAWRPNAMARLQTALDAGSTDR